ncbi:hypothetical protein QM012_005796 [Aureobasidium pullulans]|uniref:MIT domain-containing protein n=1 Tax=Aureobasidium pullulans TaxID=5580 RepID=A0ABR0TQR4_AURPU
MLHTGAAQAGDATHARQHQHQQRQYHDRFDLTRAPSPGGDSILTVRLPGHQIQHQDDLSRRTSLLHDRGPSDSSQWSHTERHGHGLANLNRWSHSTASSVASIDTPPTAIKHSQPHTNPSSHGFHTGSIWARRNVSDAQMSPEDVSPRSIAYQRPQAMQSPEYHRRRVPRFEKPLPPRMSISNHSPNDDAQLTSATFTPTSAGLLTPNSYVNSDYFGSTASASSSYEKSPHTLPPRTSSRQNGSISRQDISPADSTSGRGRSQDKKMMLSKALEKANTAVLLDNAMNYEGALEAYRDACRLLENVLDRTYTPDDRRKLDAIRDTYTIRIDELLQIQLTTQATRKDKQLPPRPMSNESLVSNVSGPDRSSAIIETATLTRIIDAPPSTDVSPVPSPVEGPPTSFLAVSPAQGPRTSFLTSAIQEVEGTSNTGAFLGPLWERERSRSPFRDSIISHETARPCNLEPALMPRPLTPRGYDEQETSLELDSRPTTAESQDVHHNTDPVSWLDTIDESGSSGSPSTSSRSPSSSVHERSPRRGVHRRDISAALSHASLDFDAAFDAAIEAAYEDGYEVDDDFLVHPAPVQDNQTSHEPDLNRPSASSLGQYLTFDGQLDDDEAEEERILADITNDYIDHGFDFGIQSKSALPRQSDSSTYSGRTYQSSQVSNRTTAGTSLSTVAENTVSRHTPSSSLATDISKTSPEQISGAQQTTTPSRRTAGPNFKQLKIETSRKPTLRSRGFTNTEPKEAADVVDAEEEADADRRISEVPSLRRVEAALASPYHMRSAASDTATPMSLDSLPENGDVLNNSFRSPRPKLFRGRNKSSLSLRETGGFISEETDTAPASPMSAFPGGGEVPPFRRYITPPGGSISITRTDSASGGHHIFESFLNPPNQPPSPGADDSYSPSSLEPCPEPTLLRPFWMLRCIANVLNQPRGGFLTTRLFVPRQIWMNRNVKLKSVEDKISNCDLLTAALGKLSKVDTYDADAVLEELQGFEEVMERVQTVLMKRLGSEVGVQGVSALFKDAQVSVDSTGTTADAREPKQNKSYLSSWRKLRGKNSSGGVTIPLSSSRTEKEVPNMTSVPMTSFVSIDKRTAYKHITSKETNSFEGPHKEYMSSVSRLCEAAQVLDQVARQVEDPGLKHSSPTHIGLELSTRHAAEFFGFYICRFVLGDVTLLMDKYVKRSTEWVIA